MILNLVTILLFLFRRGNDSGLVGSDIGGYLLEQLLLNGHYLQDSSPCVATGLEWFLVFHHDVHGRGGGGVESIGGSAGVESIGGSAGVEPRGLVDD